MGGKARQQVFDLLAQAPSDTLRALSVFLRTEVCEPTGSKLVDIGDKTLVKHLDGLINGVSSVLPERSARARQASKGTPLAGKRLAWGFGDASRSGEWHGALEAVRRFVEDRSTDDASWRIGQTVAYLSGLLDKEPTNRELTALVMWLLDGELRFDLEEHLYYKLTRSCQVSPNFENDWERKPWGELGVSEESLYPFTLALCEGSAAKARQLVAALL
jgi:hypothetical protein